MSPYRGVFLVMLWVQSRRRPGMLSGCLRGGRFVLHGRG